MPANQRGMWRRQRRTIELDLNREKKRPLGPGDEFAKIEWHRRGGIEHRGIHQQIKRVASVAARDGGQREVLRDQAAVFPVRQHGAHLLIDPGLQRIRARAFRREFIGIQGAEHALAAIAEKPADRNEMLARAAVNDRVRAAGIVPHHAADHRAVSGGGFRTEEHAMG